VDRAARARLPLYTTIPAAQPGELTPANGLPKGKTFLTWQRSHGDNGGLRYSALTQINRRNVAGLAVAWTYHSHDAGVALECNPIIVRDIMLTPTPGDNVVAVNAASGVELWRFKPEGRPAFRGLIYWPGRRGAAERVLFTSGAFLYALDPKTGRPVEMFGEHGKITLPGRAMEGYGASTAAPTIFDGIIIVPGFLKDVWGFDVATGRLLWTFHTVPREGEWGYDTWLWTKAAASPTSRRRRPSPTSSGCAIADRTCSAIASSPLTPARAGGSGIFRRFATIYGTWTFPPRPTWPPLRATAGAWTS
jgi:glucose dehydrogenase